MEINILFLQQIIAQREKEIKRRSNIYNYALDTLHRIPFVRENVPDRFRSGTMLARFLEKHGVNPSFPGAPKFASDKVQAAYFRLVHVSSHPFTAPMTAQTAKGRKG